MKVKITLNATVAKTLEVPDDLPLGSAELLDVLLDGTPQFAMHWDTFQIHSERYTTNGVPINFGGSDRSTLLSELFLLSENIGTDQEEFLRELRSRLERLVSDADDQSGDAGKEERT